VNRRFVEMTGYSADEVVGQTPRLLKSGEMSEETYEVLWKSIAAGNPWIGELRNRHKSGALYWERVSVTPIVDADGRVTHFLALQEDVTGQKLAKEDLTHSHAQLLASLARQSGDLARLNQAGDLLQRCLTEAEAYRALVYAVEQLALGRGGALALIAPADGGLVTAIRWGDAPAISDRFAAEACWAVRRAGPHPVVDVARGLLCSHFDTPPPPYLCLPLLLRGRSLGLLHIVLADQTDEVELTRLTQVGTALGNAFALALEHLRRG
jgi:PAS domain S-box-containing protein